MTRRGGLGRGLGALIPTGPNDETLAAEGPEFPSAAVTFRELAISSIRPNPRQPRQIFDPEALAELVSSVREVGLLQPVVVRPLYGAQEEFGFELVMGERRWRAAAEAGFTHIPAIVRETEDNAMLRDALLENLHRASLNPLEEAAAYAQLLEEFHVTHEQLALRLGRSRSQVTNTVRLLGLPAAVQRRVAAGVLSAGHARALLGLSDPEQQEALAGQIVAEGLSVRTTEELVALARTGDGSPPARRPRQRVVDPRADALAERLAECLDTRVRVELGQRRGKLVVEVADLADLGRIVALIAGAEG